MHQECRAVFHVKVLTSCSTLQVPLSGDANPVCFASVNRRMANLGERNERSSAEPLRTTFRSPHWKTQCPQHKSLLRRHSCSTRTAAELHAIVWGWRARKQSLQRTCGTWWSGTLAQRIPKFVALQHNATRRAVFTFSAKTPGAGRQDLNWRAGLWFSSCDARMVMPNCTKRRPTRQQSQRWFSTLMRLQQNSSRVHPGRPPNRKTCLVFPCFFRSFLNIHIPSLTSVNAPFASYASMASVIEWSRRHFYSISSFTFPLMDQCFV